MASCVMCGRPLPSSHKHKTCSMCYGDIDYGTDGYYREWAEIQERKYYEKAEQDRVDSLYNKWTSLDIFER